MNIKRITSFTYHKTGEGDRLSYIFSEIDSNGNLITSNERATCIIMDSEIIKKITDINEFLQDKLA